MKWKEKVQNDATSTMLYCGDGVLRVMTNVVCQFDITVWANAFKSDGRYYFMCLLSLQYVQRGIYMTLHSSMKPCCFLTLANTIHNWSLIFIYESLPLCCCYYI